MKTEVQHVDPAMPQAGVEVSFEHAGHGGSIRVSPIKDRRKMRLFCAGYQLNWAAYGSVDTEFAHAFAEALKKALGVARRLTARYGGKPYLFEPIEVEPEPAPVCWLRRRNGVQHAFNEKSQWSVCGRILRHNSMVPAEPGPLNCTTCEHRIRDARRLWERNNRRET